MHIPLGWVDIDIYDILQSRPSRPVQSTVRTAFSTETDMDQTGPDRTTATLGLTIGPVLPLAWILNLTLHPYKLKTPRAQSMGFITFIATARRVYIEFKLSSNSASHESALCSVVCIVNRWNEYVLQRTPSLGCSVSCSGDFMPNIVTSSNSSRVRELNVKTMIILCIVFRKLCHRTKV